MTINFYEIYFVVPCKVSFDFDKIHNNIQTNNKDHQTIHQQTCTTTVMI